jgi:PAS domain S-box-containing protein
VQPPSGPLARGSCNTRNSAIRHILEVSQEAGWLPGGAVAELPPWRSGDTLGFVTYRASASHRITVVDDQPDVAELLDELLTEFGYTVRRLICEEPGVDDIAATDPDLVILDLHLAGGHMEASGWDLLRLMRGDARFMRTPVLLCTADQRALRERHDEFLDDPLVAELPKPFRIDDAETIVRRLLDGVTAPRWDDRVDLVVVADERARLVDASDAVLRLLGVTLSELRGREVGDIVAQPRAWTDAEWQQYQAAGHWEGSVVLKRADGTAIEARAAAEIVRTAERVWYVSRLSVDTPP